jgi:hypothetical protein
MSLGLQAGYRIYEASSDTNAAGVLVSGYLAGGSYVRRMGIVSEVAAGLLAPTVVKLSYSIDGGATFVDVTGATLTTGVRARGVYLYRNLDLLLARIPSGALVAMRTSTLAGAGNVARCILEIEPQPFSGSNIPTAAVQVLV